jgi:hypothetical protein
MCPVGVKGVLCCSSYCTLHQPKSSPRLCPCYPPGRESCLCCNSASLEHSCYHTFHNNITPKQDQTEVPPSTDRLQQHDQMLLQATPAATSAAPYGAVIDSSYALLRSAPSTVAIMTARDVSDRPVRTQCSLLHWPSWASWTSVAFSDCRCNTQQ